MNLEFKGPIMIDPELVLFFENKEEELLNNITDTYLLNKDMSDYNEKFYVEKGQFLNPETFKTMPSIIIKRTSECTEEDITYITDLYKDEKKKYIDKLKRELSDVPLAVKIDEENNIVVFVKEEYLDKIEKLPYLNDQDKDIYIMKLATIIQKGLEPLNRSFEGKAMTEENINSYKTYLETEYKNYMFPDIVQLINVTIDYRIA